jgi:hypothetical protein
MNLVELFCQVDDFCQRFEAQWIRHQLTTGHRRRRRTGQLCLSEIMTLLIWFHSPHYRDFKAFYKQHVCIHLRDAFPGLVSYHRFIELVPSALIPLCAEIWWSFWLSLRITSFARKGDEEKHVAMFLVLPELCCRPSKKKGRNLRLSQSGNANL